MTKKYFGIPAYEGSLSRRVTYVKLPNPKRAGAASALRYDQYRVGMTIAQYIQACKGIGQGRLAIFDITWDTDPRRHFIELSD